MTGGFLHLEETDKGGGGAKERVCWARSLYFLGCNPEPAKWIRSSGSGGGEVEI